MRNAETVLGIIRERGTKGLYLEDVYRQLYNPDLYLRAYGRLYRNEGSLTEGATGETVDGMSLKKIGAIIDHLRHERYRWTAVRRTYIPKKDGRRRPLGIPTWSDKLLQEVMRSILEAYYEPQFSDHSHGFRPGRGCHSALSEVQHNWHGTRWFIEGDIKGCFDNIDHAVLLAILREKIRDNRFLILVEGLLKAGYLEDWSYRPTHSGTPQGGVVSPILANIYLDRLDRFVEETLIPEFTRGKHRRLNKAYQLILQKVRRRRARGRYAEARELAKTARTMPTIDPQDSDYRRLRYIRYADDFLLAFCGPRAEAEEIKDRLATFLRDDLKLELSREKTLISHARTRPARFLGYEIAIQHCDSYRALNGRVDLRLPSDVLKAKCDRYMRDGKPVHLAGRAVASDFSLVAQYGLEYRGIVQYYALARNVRWLGRLHWVMGTSLLKTLASKHKSTVSQMARRYGCRVATSNGQKTCLRVVIEREGKGPLIAQFGGIPLKRTRRAILDDVPVTPFLNKRSEIERRLLADACEICGSTERVQVHHVRRLSDLVERGRREKPDWVMQMAALRRKTLVVCEKCHVDIHAGRPLRRPTSS